MVIYLNLSGVGDQAVIVLSFVFLDCDPLQPIHRYKTGKKGHLIVGCYFSYLLHFVITLDQLSFLK